MKITGIILIILGAISLLGAIIGAAKGFSTNFSGVLLLVIGLFLVSTANKKIERENNKDKWGKT